MVTHVGAEEGLVESLDAWVGRRQDLLADPYPMFHRLQEEAPVFSYRGKVLVSRYADVERVVRDPGSFSSVGLAGGLVPDHLDKEDLKAFFQVRNFTGLWMTSVDPPEHTRLRGLVHKVFTPRRVALMRDDIQSITDELIAQARRQGTIEVVEDYAHRLPINVICSMLRVPESDWEQLREWSGTLASNGGTNFENVRAVARSVEEITAYVHDLIAERRRSGATTDLLAALISVELDGDRLSEEELEAMVVLLVMAGHETTTALVTNGLYRLLTHPDQLATLRADWSLAPQAVEELLRFDSNIQVTTRQSTRDVILSDVAVPAGSTVWPILAAANRDWRQFPDPDRLDILRSDIKHLDFLIGPHYCLGQALARLEAAISIESFLRAFPQAEIMEEIRWRENFLQRRVESLVLKLA